jgi:hypothetical protein
VSNEGLQLITSLEINHLSVGKYWVVQGSLSERLLHIVPYAVFMTMSSIGLGSTISESAFGVLVSVLAFCCLAIMRFEALSICFCCLAFSFARLPKLYMDFPIFNSYVIFLSSVTEYYENGEAPQNRISQWSASFFTQD